MRELALFAGAGGGILGGHLLGWRTVCAVEVEDYPRRVLLARQRDGILPRFPIWDDVQTFNGHPWQGRVDVISGGFPCTDISSAGIGAGIDGDESGLWSEMARVVREVGPRHVFVENSPMLTSRGLGTVLGDLAEMGFDAKWGVLGGYAAGCPCAGERIWIVATAHESMGAPRVRIHEEPEQKIWSGDDIERAKSEWWKLPPKGGDSRMDARLANRVERLECLGNGQVPAVAALAWRVLTSGEK